MSADLNFWGTPDNLSPTHSPKVTAQGMSKAIAVASPRPMHCATLSLSSGTIFTQNGGPQVLDARKRLEITLGLNDFDAFLDARYPQD